MGWKLVFLGYFTLLSTASHALVNADVKTLFVPVGFDDNDEIVVVADGYLASPCLKLTTPLVLPNLQTKRIVVQPRAKLVEGECKWDFRVPFTQVITLTSLPKGNYLVTTEDGKATERLGVVEATTGAVDNSMYAPIDKVRIRITEEGKFEAVVEGRFSDNCFRVSEMKLFNSGKTLELLPMMDRREGGDCEPKETPFVARHVLPDLAPGRYLLHVRSLNGQSANDVFNNYWVH